MKYLSGFLRAFGWLWIPALAMAAATSYNYFAPGGALSCSGVCTTQSVDLTQSGFVSGPLRVGAGGTGTNSTLTGLLRGGSPLTGAELSGDVSTSGSNTTTLNPAISPTITGNWTYTPTVGVGVTINAQGSNNALNVVGSNGQTQFDSTGDQIVFTRNAFNFITATGASATLQIQASGSGGALVFATNGAARESISSAGAITMPSLASSSAATTGTVCWTTGGNLTVDTTVACLASTKRVKEHIEPLEVGLSEVMALRPVSYHLKAEHNPTHLGPQVGLVAEDVAAVDERLVARDDEGLPRGVRYMQLTAVLIKAIQEQQQEIASLRTQVRRLQRTTRQVSHEQPDMAVDIRRFGSVILDRAHTNGPEP